MYKFVVFFFKIYKIKTIYEKVIYKQQPKKYTHTSKSRVDKQPLGFLVYVLPLSFMLFLGCNDKALLDVDVSHRQTELQKIKQDSRLVYEDARKTFIKFVRMYPNGQLRGLQAQELKSRWIDFLGNEGLNKSDADKAFSEAQYFSSLDESGKWDWIGKKGVLSAEEAKSLVTDFLHDVSLVGLDGACDRLESFVFGSKDISDVKARFYFNFIFGMKFLNELSPSLFSNLSSHPSSPVMWAWFQDVVKDDCAWSAAQFVVKTAIAVGGAVVTGGAAMWWSAAAAVATYGFGIRSVIKDCNLYGDGYQAVIDGWYEKDALETIK